MKMSDMLWLPWPVLTLAASCAAQPATPLAAPPAPATAAATPGGGAGTATTLTAERRRYPKPADLRTRLTPMQYNVTQLEWTEPPYRNEFWNQHDAGLYVDIVTGEPLFISTDKYDSKTGWPSFTRPLVAERVAEKADHKLGYLRREVHSVASGSHLGHIFEDGPQPTGLRYCINSAALRFIPLAELEAQGYGEYRSQFGAGH